MRQIFLIISCAIILIICDVDASFVNPYPRYKAYRDNNDPGEPLYLTKYIESGNVELVSFVCFSYCFSFDFHGHDLALCINIA